MGRFWVHFGSQIGYPFSGHMGHFGGPDGSHSWTPQMDGSGPAYGSPGYCPGHVLLQYFAVDSKMRYFRNGAICVGQNIGCCTKITPTPDRRHFGLCTFWYLFSAPPMSVRLCDQTRWPARPSLLARGYILPWTGRSQTTRFRAVRHLQKGPGKIGFPFLSLFERSKTRVDPDFNR